MGYLDYSNETLTNIFPKENFEELVQEVFNVVSTNICRSLGPLGSSATILQGMMEPEATKDGYSILSKYSFRNEYKRMIYNLIKAPCTKMNNIVGDATTTAIALTNALFNRYKMSRGRFESLYRLPRQFTKTWDSVIEELQEKIKDKAVPINPKDYDTIYRIAYVTSNGNEEVSTAIAKVYSEAEAPYIKQKDSPSNKSYIETVNGYSFPANLISDIYARNEDMTVNENDFAVMAFDFKLEADFFETVVIPINEVFRAKKKKVLIIAPAYDKKMCDELLSQYVLKEMRTGGINLILTQYSTSKLGENQMVDMCTVMKSKIINDVLAKDLVTDITASGADTVVDKVLNDPEYTLSRIIGNAKHGLLSMTAGVLLTADDDIVDDPMYQSALASARNVLNKLISETDAEKNSYSSKIYHARDRVLQLEMKNFIYYVGADSQLQKNILWDSITDVIKCVRSAVRCGIVPGCQLTIIQSCDELLGTIDINDANPDANIPDSELLRREIITMIKYACVDVYAKVLTGPDGTGIIKTIPDWKTATEKTVDQLMETARKKTIDIMNQSVSKNQVFDIESLEFNDNIITSAETDQLVLLAATELIKILISGNQAIIIREDVDSSHEEQMIM